MPTMEEMKACPLCRSPFINQARDLEGGVRQIFCKACGCSAPIAAWNRRAPSPALGGEVECLSGRDAPSDERQRAVLRWFGKIEAEWKNRGDSEAIVACRTLRAMLLQKEKHSMLDASLALEEMLIRHYGTPAERADQVERYGLSDPELSCQIESDARAALSQEGLVAGGDEGSAAAAAPFDTGQATPAASRSAPYEMSKEWCLQSAQIEGDAEIGAGRLRVAMRTDLALERIFALMDEAEEALDRDTYEQFRRDEFDPPNDADYSVCAGTVIKCSKLFAELDKLRREQAAGVAGGEQVRRERSDQSEHPSPAGAGRDEDDPTPPVSLTE